MSAMVTLVMTITARFIGDQLIGGSIIVVAIITVNYLISWKYFAKVRDQCRIVMKCQVIFVMKQSINCLDS